MAGGQGKRLSPLTQSKPKPMLPLGNKPILEVLMEQFKNSGFSRFFLTVSHMADQITDYFGDGSRWGVHIEYLKESSPLGTVGGLRLIKQPIKEPLLVANGDILTKVNFGALLEFHKMEKAAATLCVKLHETQVPYGVVEIAGYRLQSFVEKPTQKAYINAGIYVLEPEIISWLPRGKPCDMPNLIARIRRRRKNGVACFPIQEYWMDIGEMHAYQRASGDYSQFFE
jgi:NDP-sugar pyrophosphorylase family protein